MSNKRPLSPHLSIYRWQITNTLSILHRMTGVGLVGGAVLFTVWIFFAAYAPGSYALLHHALASMFGKVFLLGWTVAFFYHLSNGIRHLLWDTGAGFELGAVARSGWTVLIFTVAMTALTWGILLNQ